MNPYTSRYTNNIDNIGYIYEPVHSPEETEAWSRILKDRQNRYDIGQQKLSDAITQFSSINSLDPEYMTKNIEEFTSKVENMVNSDYNRDYGLAANDIMKEIAKEKGKSIYKYNDYLNKQAAIQNELKTKYGNKYVLGNDVMKPGLLKSAVEGTITDKNGNQISPIEAMTAKVYERPNYGDISLNYARMIHPDVVEKLVRPLGISDQKELENLTGMAQNNPIKFYQTIMEKSPNTNLVDAIDNITNLMYEDNKDVLLAEYRTKDDAIEALTPIVENSIGIPKYKETHRQLGSINTSQMGNGQGEPNNPPLTVPDGMAAKTNENSEFIENYEKDLAELEQFFKDEELKKKALKDGSVAEAVFIATEKQIEKNKTKKNEMESKMNRFDSEIARLDSDQNFKYPSYVNINDRKSKRKFIASLEDNYNNESKSLLSPSSFNEGSDIADNVNKTLQNEPKNIVNLQKFDTDENKWVEIGAKQWIKGNPYNFDLSNQISNVSVKDFAFSGIDPKDGSVRYSYNKGKAFLKGYPSDQAEFVGKGLEQSYSNLKQHGFSKDASLGKDALHIKVFDKNLLGSTEGMGYTDKVVFIPPKYANEKVETYDDALNLYNKIAREVYPIHRKTAIINFIQDNGEKLGYTYRRPK
jgi:hypothetical protein